MTAETGGTSAGSRPVVSVIVIFRDEGRFLGDAIASVVGQEGPEWELLLVDDGSVDEGTSIARRWAAEQPGRIRYLEHPGHTNLGMSRSRNLGLECARGDLVAFLDGDDTWNPNTLADQVAALQASAEAAMVYGPIEYWFSWTGRDADRQRDYVEPLGVPAGTLIRPPSLVPLFLRDRAAVPSGLLVRRDAALAVGGFEDAFRGEYEDQAFLAKLCLHLPVLPVGRCWYRYRQHPGSAVSTGQRTGATESARRAFLGWLWRYLAAQPARWRHPGPSFACQIELWRFTRPRVYQAVWWCEHPGELIRRLRRAASLPR